MSTTISESGERIELGFRCRKPFVGPIAACGERAHGLRRLVNERPVGDVTVVDLAGTLRSHVPDNLGTGFSAARETAISRR